MVVPFTFSYYPRCFIFCKVITCFFVRQCPVDTLGDVAAAFFATVNAIRLALASHRLTIRFALALVPLARIE